MRYGVKRKRGSKRLKHIGNLLRKKTTFKRCLLNLDFYRQRISESSCARKETVDIEIFVTSSNGGRKIM